MKLQCIKLLTLLIAFFAMSLDVFAQAIVAPALYAPINGGARVLATQGTAASPDFGFSGSGVVPANLNDGGGGNGIFRPLANTMAFSTSSTERMRLTSTGWLGLGTMTPSQKLQLSGGNLMLDYSDVSATTGSLFFGGVTYPSNQNGMRLSFFNSAAAKNAFIDVRTYGAGGTTNDGLIFRVDASSTNTERMRICANGRVAIGTVTPTTKLNVASSSSNDGIRINQTGATAATLSLQAGGVGGKNWALFSTGPGNSEGAGHFTFYDWTANAERMRITSAGDLGVGLTINPSPGYRLFVGGSAYVSGGLFVASDNRFKKEVHTINSAMATVNRLRGVQYEYRQNEFAERHLPAGKTDGFIAQELREVLPELVQEGTDGFLAVNYQGLIPVLTEALKELKAEKDMEISELETRLAEKDRQLSALEARLARLETALDRTATPATTLPNVQMSNQPNPFSGTTTIKCVVPVTAHIAELIVTDMTGREIKRQILSERGQVSMELNLKMAAAGTYISTLMLDGKAVGALKLVVDNQ